MLHITNSMRWGVGLWCAVAIGLVASSITLGAQPATTVLLLGLSCVPVGVFAGLAQLRPQGRTSTQVLYDGDRDDRRDIR